MMGRPRDPVNIILVGVLTLGLGLFVYYFRAFREVDFQNGRRHSGALILSLVPFVGWIAAHLYVRTELDRLREDRRRVGLVDTMSANHHLMLVLIGLVPSFLLAILATSAWLASSPSDEPNGRTLLLAWTSAGLALLGPGLAIPALSRTINEYWIALGAKPLD